jgi:predicted SnoaL-like aldol condensation-catalyzing enzyme
MSAQQNKATVRRLYDEVLNQQRIAIAPTLATEDYVEHDPLPGQGDGAAGLADRMRMLVDAFAPRFDVDDVVAEGDRVVVR